MDFSTTKKQANSSQARSSSMANKYCSNCGQESSDDARFCPGCGRPGHEMPQVTTPEANVPVPPPLQPAGGSSQLTEAVAQSAPSPSPQPQQQSLGLWQQFRRPILWFLGGVVFAGLSSAAFAPRLFYFGSSFTSYAIDQMLQMLIVFVPLWLILGGLIYLEERLRGKSPSLLQMIFNRWLTIFIVILVLLTGLRLPISYLL